MNNSNVAGIYCITSLVNGKRYFGQSVDIENRWKRHLSDLRLNRHHSQHLQRHFNKYGVNDLIHSIVEVVNIEGLSKEQINQILCEKEQPYLHYKNLFNICIKAGTTLGIKQSEKHKKFIRNRGRKSGAGISFKKGKYSITFRYKKSYFFGSYLTKEEALNIRLKAEAEIWTDEFDNLTEEDQLAIINKYTKTARKSGLGVLKTKHNSWQSVIHVAKYKVILGSYPTYEQALKARLNAEKVFWTDEFEQLTPIKKQSKIKEYKTTIGSIKTEGKSYTGELYIKFMNNRYQFSYRKTKEYKSFLTLQEAIKFRDDYLNLINNTK